MKLKLAGIRVEECQKPGCGKRLLQRHHKGSERMWLRHFAHRKRTQRYRTFAKRYWAFTKKDCCSVCESHHLEVHQIYAEIIGRAMRKCGLKPMKQWTWDEAEKLMQELREACDTWLKKKTPGLRGRRKMPWAKQSSSIRR